MNKIKKIKIRKANGQTTDYVDIGVDAKNVDLQLGGSLEEKLRDLDKKTQTLEGKDIKFTWSDGVFLIEKIG